MGGLADRLRYAFAPESVVLKAQSDYVRFFERRGGGPVVDLGCGRGLFLDLLRSGGIPAIGVDTAEEPAAEARAKGHDVALADATAFLREAGRSGRSFGGVFCSQIIEHMGGDDGVALFEACALALSPGSALVVVTPNAGNPLVMGDLFWCDPTHVRPYPARLLCAMAKECGLEVEASYADARTRPRPAPRRLLKRLRYGVQAGSGFDVVVVARRPDSR